MITGHTLLQQRLFQHHSKPQDFRFEIVNEQVDYSGSYSVPQLARLLATLLTFQGQHPEQATLSLEYHMSGVHLGLLSPQQVIIKRLNLVVLE